jgi:hypothetical protein
MKKEIHKIEKTLEIIKKYADHSPEIPEKNCFYKTYNSSIVFVYQVDNDGEAMAVALQGGVQDIEPGETYWLTEEGCYKGNDISPKLVMALLKKIDIKLPKGTGIRN